MTIRVSDALKHITHAIGGGELSLDLDAYGIVHQAGDYLYSMHPWHFTKRRSDLIDLRGMITITNAQWTEASLTITKTNAFTNYTFVDGDTFNATAGTNVTTGHYAVSSVPTGSTVVLEQSIGSAADGDTDIGGVFRLGSVALPADFRSLIAIASTDNLVQGVRMTSIENILENRSTQLDADTDWDYLGAIVYSGSPPSPIMEIWPYPSTSEAGKFTIFYRKRFTRPTMDTDILDVPDFAESLYFRIVRAYAKGYELEGLDDAAGEPFEIMLERIRQGPEFRAAMTSDASLQWRRGTITGGGSQLNRGYISHSRIGVTPWRISGPS